jgi:tetratricopeptide (TPR) repeat protein
LNRSIDISQEEFEEIEKFILQQTSADEQDAFTKRLETDTGFQQKFETVNLLLIGVQEAELTKKLEDFHRNLLLSTKKNRVLGKTSALKNWLVAASVIVITGFASLFYLNSDTKEEQLFAEFYRPDPGLLSAMSSTDNYLFDRAMVDYKSGEYLAAIKIWEGMLTSKPGNDTLNYFLGSAYLAKEKNEVAIIHFQKVLANDNSYFQKDALWYTGLALLKENKITQAIPFIEKSEHHDKESLLIKLKEEE